MPFALCRRVLPAALLPLLVLAWPELASAALPRVPEGFEVRLVATVPAVLYPCQVGTAPDGALFVAEDPMDQVGPYEANHGRILIFRDGKDPVVFADGFRAIQGMAWYEGSLYVSHMPFLTVLRDLDGDDKAESRRDLFKDLGPTDNRGLNDHIVSGIQFGLDGYLYISVGDKGIPKATGPDGRTIQIVGGGTCRCRPDGTGLEVISTGTRNHLEPNLDDRDNLFTYDNTDDGLGWWTRVTHHIDGGYYGYPYDYHDRPDRHLPRMAEYGGGSPCGAVLYKEDAWPESYRGVGFWAEWGKGKVHAFRFAPNGATFKVAEAIDFAVSGGVDGFRPIDLALSYDGRTLYVADWGMGSWGSKTEKVGRIWAITAKNPRPARPRGADTDSAAAQVALLAHPSFNERMRAQRTLIKRGSLDEVKRALGDPSLPGVARRHLLWAYVALEHDPAAFDQTLGAVLTAPEADLRAQAVRALGLRETASRTPAAVDRAVVALGDAEPTVRLQAVITLGRLGASRGVAALLRRVADADPTVAFSARQALRRIGAWDETAAGLASENPTVRAGVLAAMELVYDPVAVRSLSKFAADARRAPDERARAVLYLAQVHRKTRPWDGKWWGTRPAAGTPPGRVVAWDETPAVLAAVRARIGDEAVAVRAAAVAAVLETRDREALPALRDQFEHDPDTGVRVAVARTLGGLDDEPALPRLVAALRDRGTPAEVRDAALAAVESIGSDAATRALIDLVKDADTASERKTHAIAALGRLKARPAVVLLVQALDDPAEEIRAAAAEALGRIRLNVEGAGPALRARLNDRATAVRKAAIDALGALKDREALPALLAAAQQNETHFEATKALAAMPDLLALQVYLAGLADRSPDLRKASAQALGEIRDDAAPVLDQLYQRRELPARAVPELRKIYTALEPIREWHVLGPVPLDGAIPVSPSEPIDLGASHVDDQGKPMLWTLKKAAAAHGEMRLNSLYPNHERPAVLAYAEISSPVERRTSMAVGSDDTLTVWLNGKQVYAFSDHRGFAVDQARFDVTLQKGTNRVLVKCGNYGGPWEFAVALSGTSAHAFLNAPVKGGFDPEAFRAFAAKGRGKADHGRALFEDVKGLACVRCHSVGKQGGTVGPELSSAGAKYSRDELIASVLYPSARISSGYEPVVVATVDGRIITGIIKSETPEAIELDDAEAKRVRLLKDEVDDRKRSDVSLMPNGLVEGLSRQDFADLIAYLETLKEVPAAPPESGPKR